MGQTSSRFACESHKRISQEEKKDARIQDIRSERFFPVYIVLFLLDVSGVLYNDLGLNHPRYIKP